MRFHYDKSVDALYIRFNEQKYRESDEVAEGIIMDYDRKGKIIGIEILDASKRFSKDLKKSFGSRKIPAIFDILKQAPAR